MRKRNGGDRKRGVPLLRIKMAGNAGDREDQIWAANYLSRPSRCRRSSFTSSRSCPKPCFTSHPPTMASAAAAADRILKPYFDLAVSSPPFRFRGSGFSSLAQISRSPGFCICRRFFSWSFGGVFARGSFESFGFCARLRLLGAVFGVFDPPVRVFLCVFSRVLLGFVTLGENPLCLGVHVALVLSRCRLGEEYGGENHFPVLWIVSLDLLFLQRLLICCRSWPWARQATPATSWRRRRR
jgi:hypothetical protein